MPGTGTHFRGARGLRLHAADHHARAAARRWRHSGEEARWARSDLPARRLLARVFACLFLMGAVGFGLLAAGAPRADRGFDVAVAAVCALCAVIAVADLAVLRRRFAEQERWGRDPGPDRRRPWRG